MEALRRRDSFRDWEELDEIYRDSNRDQAAHIPVKLSAIGCDLAPMSPGEDHNTFTFREPEDGQVGEVDILARLEHERWMDERRLRQPHHAAMLPWKDLRDEEKQKDYDAIRALPELLEGVGLKIIRVNR